MAALSFLRPKTLRTKALFVLVLMFLLFSSFATFKAYNTFKQDKIQTYSQLQGMAKWIETDQLYHFAQARQTAFIVMNLIRRGAISNYCQSGITNEPGLSRAFGRFALVDPNGQVTCNSISGLTKNNINDQGYFRQTIQSVEWSVIAAIDHNGAYHAVLARAMRDNGHVEKIILVAMDFSWIRQEVEGAQLSPQSHLLVIDANGTIISGTQNVSDWVNKSIVDTPFYKQILAHQNATFDGLGFSGQKSIVSAHQIETGSGIMRVVIDTPYDDLLLPIYRNLAFTIGLSTLIFFCVIVLVYKWIDACFLRKIMIIEQTTRQLANGNWSARIHLQSDGELKRMADAFDAMADNLQAQKEQVESANEELYRINRAIRVLSAGNKSLLYSKTENELLEKICRDIVEVGDYLAAWIGFTGPEQDRYLHTAAAYSRSEDQSVRIDWNTAGNGLIPVITAVRENRVLVINDTLNESIHPHLGEQAAKFGYRSVIILPLHFETKPFGALILCALRENEFGDAQIEYLQETALDTSFGIELLRTKGEKDRLMFLGEHSEIVLRHSLEDTLQAIARTIEMRDPYTAGHQRNVAGLAKAIALELGLKDDDIHGIYLAAIVHDIGKINVPAEILVKPGRLNDMELGIVKNHAAAGYEILKDIKFPWPIADMVHQHHERIDGSGYPQGLKDGDIVFGARILAVADVVEAMTSHRPYRPGLGIEVALSEIQRGKGDIYDSVVVEACMKLFNEGLFKF